MIAHENTSYNDTWLIMGPESAWGKINSTKITKVGSEQAWTMTKEYWHKNPKFLRFRARVISWLPLTSAAISGLFLMIMVTWVKYFTQPGARLTCPTTVLGAMLWDKFRRFTLSRDKSRRIVHLIRINHFLESLPLINTIIMEGS